MYKNIKLEKEDGIGILTINRPKALNALNTKTLLELRNMLLKIEKDKKINVLIITGEGEKAFVAGADIGEMRKKNPLKAMEFAKLGQGVFSQIENLSAPTIAAVNGFALGGGTELALACDIRIASENAKFGQPEVNLGVMPGFGGTQRLPRIVGKGIASELIFTGEIIDANEAFRIGLVNKVVKPDKLMDESKSFARKIMSKGLVAVKLAKSAINQGMNVDLASGLKIEAEAFSICFSTKDQKEGMTAFLEKREPKFKGK